MTRRGDGWTLREKWLWIPDRGSTSKPAAYTLRFTAVAYVVIWFGLLVANLVRATVWLAQHADAEHVSTHALVTHYTFPWWVGIPFALVPSVTTCALGPRARTGSALEYAGLMLLLVGVSVFFFDHWYHLLAAVPAALVIAGHLVTLLVRKLSGAPA